VTGSTPYLVLGGALLVVAGVGYYALFSWLAARPRRKEEGTQ